MRGQDSRATAHPIYVVQQRRRVFGFGPACSDDASWINDEGYEVTDPATVEWLDNEWVNSGDNPEGYVRAAYQDFWEWVQPFFSQRAAEDYIDANRHNLTDPRVYVASGYRNDEWICVRQALVGGEHEA